MEVMKPPSEVIREATQSPDKCGECNKTAEFRLKCGHFVCWDCNHQDKDACKDNQILERWSIISLKWQPVRHPRTFGGKSE